MLRNNLWKTFLLLINSQTENVLYLVLFVQRLRKIAPSYSYITYRKLVLLLFAPFHVIERYRLPDKLSSKKFRRRQHGSPRIGSGEKVSNFPENLCVQRKLYIFCRFSASSSPSLSASPAQMSLTRENTLQSRKGISFWTYRQSSIPNNFVSELSIQTNDFHMYHLHLYNKIPALPPPLRWCKKN